MTAPGLTYARIAGLRAAAAARPGDAEALCALGTALGRAGRHDEAQEVLERAVRADPRHRGALTNLGNVLAARGCIGAAVARYEEVLALDPADAVAQFNLGCARLREGDAVAAAHEFRAVLALRPEHAEALNNLGSALRLQGDAVAARACYRRALALRADIAGIHNNLGSAELALGRADRALGSLRTAVRLAPENAEFCNNLGGALLALDRPAEAAGWFREAVKHDPAACQARFGLAVALLAQGDFRAGWEAYESRWADPAFTADEHAFDRPGWSGEAPVAGRTMLLHAEQGHGDTLQFVRYAPLLRARGARVVLQVQAPLVALLGGLGDAVIAAGEEPPEFDLHCPLLSLPRAFGTGVESIPADIPYVRAPEGHVAAWAARLGERRRRRIGIAVAGDPAHPEDAWRSIPARRFLAAFAGVDAELHVLQKDIRPGDAAALAGLCVHDAAIADFRDSAALVALMDLVVTVDTALAHLAGAMGAPVWVLLPFGADFRWMRGRADSPWYPTARLFRQQRYRDWRAPLAAVNAALRRGFDGQARP